MEITKPIYNKKTLVDKYNELHVGDKKLSNLVLDYITHDLFAAYEMNCGYQSSTLIIETAFELYKIKLQPYKFRKYIQLIREHTFNDCGVDYPDLVIVANHKGYKLTKDAKEISHYKQILDGRRHSLIKQIIVIELAQGEEVIKCEQQDDKGMDGY